MRLPSSQFRSALCCDLLASQWEEINRSNQDWLLRLEPGDEEVAYDFILVRATRRNRSWLWVLLVICIASFVALAIIL